MHKQYEVMQRIMELLPTMEEGLVYARQKMLPGEMQQTTNMLYDVTAAFSGIEGALAGLDIEKDNLNEKASKLRRALDIIAGDQESNEGKQVLEIMQFTLEPAFKGWKEELEQVIVKTAGH